MEEQIDENLRRVYAQATEEEVPERFLTLLEQLRKQPRKADKTPGGGEGDAS
ncbi:MAG: NepR family anti-sigma factor [Rhodovulum sp.]